MPEMAKATMNRIVMVAMDRPLELGTAREGKIIVHRLWVTYI
jgi:hypothetical protein